MLFQSRTSTVSISILILGLISCSSSDNNQSSEPISFAPCADIPEVDCAAFDVPLIHDSTDNQLIDIDIARFSGIGDGPREPLLIHYGGPGSGVEIVKEIALSGDIPATVLERFDIIGIDQRGVAGKLWIDCDDLGIGESPAYPRDQRDIQVLVENSMTLANACFAEYGDGLQRVGSMAVVHDMEILRKRLNAPKLHMIGVSFGTRVSALYLEQYPQNSGRIVLDAPLRPSGSLDSLLQDTVIAEQAGFDRMLDLCGGVILACDRAAVEPAFVSRVNFLLDNGELATAEVFFQLLALAVEESDIGEALASLLIDYAFTGDPSEMLALYEQIDLNEEEGEDESDSNNSITLEKAVLCADDGMRPDSDSLVNTLSRLNTHSDFFAEAILPLAAMCVEWPAALDPIGDIRTEDAPESLIIGGTEDTRTPISWSVEMATALSGIFVSSDHLGHTTVFTRGNDCVDDIVVDFLVEGILPSDGTHCE